MIDNKFLRALFSLLCAFVLWLCVVTVVSPESEQKYYDVPVVQDVKNLESRGLMLISDANLTIDLELSGNRTDLNKLSRDNITILADLSGITSAGEHTVYYSISYPGTISSTITVINQEEQRITVVVAEYTEKDVPVVVEYEGATPADHVADKDHPLLSRNTVTLSGQKSVIDRITQAVITVDLSNRVADFSQTCEIELRDADNQAVTNLSHVSTNVMEITASVNVNLVKTLDVVLDVIPGNGLEEEDLLYSMDLEQIVVSGPVDVVKAMDQITLTIDLARIHESQTLTFDIRLPDGVTNVTNIHQVNVELTLIETTITIEVSRMQFEMINVPAGMHPEILTEKLAVVISGFKYVLDEMTQENIRITIDFTDAKEGKDTYDVTVELVGVEGAVVQTKHTVTAEVTMAASVLEG